MRRITIILFLLLSSISIYVKAQDDTVGFWQVQRNGKEVSPINVNNEQTYYLANLNDTDKVNIFYYTESPCAKCLCKLELKDESGRVVKKFERKGYGDTRPFPSTGKDLNPILEKGRIYMYFTSKYDGWMTPVFMGALKKSQ